MIEGKNSKVNNNFKNYFFIAIGSWAKDSDTRRCMKDQRFFTFLFGLAAFKLKYSRLK